mmetsp:Transcript_27903/g.67893  ORF Transcript_27903/g.67893 Transcript_27903/m.67893 type:complete len:94 (-) Transcript_27903:149-430(-)
MLLALVDSMMEQFNISKTAVIATGCVTALTLAGLLFVKQESQKRQSMAGDATGSDSEEKKVSIDKFALVGLLKYICIENAFGIGGFNDGTVQH